MSDEALMESLLVFVVIAGSLISLVTVIFLAIGAGLLVKSWTARRTAVRLARRFTRNGHGDAA